MLLSQVLNPLSNLPAKSAAFSSCFLMFEDYLICSLGKCGLLRVMEVIRKDCSLLFE